jgi:hypothetical protein
VRIDPRTGRPIRTLPTLLIPLRGEIGLDLRASSSVSGGKLVNTFAAIPDAAVSRFELNLRGGRGGILVVTGKRGICRGRQITEVETDGQNGKRHDPLVRMATPCSRKKAARLEVRKARWSGNRLSVSGRVATAARKRLKVTADCGKTRASKRVKPQRGRWRVTFSLRDRCTDSSRVAIAASYPGDPTLKPAVAKRRVKGP